MNMKALLHSSASPARLPAGSKARLTAQASLTLQAKQSGRVTTQGKVNYVEPPADGEELFTYLYDIPENQLASNIKRIEKEVTVTDIRAEADSFSLRKNGVELHKLRVPSNIDWQNPKEVEERYYPLVDAFLKQVTGATRTHIFDHTPRNGHLANEPLENLRFEQPNQPVGMVHVDYTAAGGLRRLQMLLPDEAEKLQQTPFAVIQVWRPLVGPVQSSPLGVIDAKTVEKDDLISYRLEFPGRTGYNYGVKYNPNHRWYFADQIDVDEAYVFVCYDSRRNRARFTPHTGFRDLSTGPNAPPRSSVELRSICFFENEPQQEVAKDL